MDLLSPVSRHVFTPLFAMWEGSPYLKHYRRLLRSQFDPIELVRTRQEAALGRILEYAVQSVPFWAERLRAAGLRNGDKVTIHDLQSLPLLTKADLRSYGDQLLSRAYNVSELHKHTTSGSTGISVVTYRDDACQQFKRAATLRADEWSGWRRGERVAAIWGNPQIRNDWKGRLRRFLADRDCLHLDTLKMDEPAIAQFVTDLSRLRPSLLFGHAHSLYLVATFIQARCPSAHIRPRAIISTCMVLHDFERQVIESAFACRVTNRYGCEEVSLIACECDAHEGLHVNSDCLVVELLDEEGSPCAPGKPGRVVVTDLVNRAMPMIRYEVGDIAKWSARTCSCGRTLPLLSHIEGRVADYVVTASGSYISGISLTENFAVQVRGVAQMQIIQNAIDDFTFVIVRGTDFDQLSEHTLEHLVRKRFGESARYKCHFVDRIPPEPSGKYRFCISHVPKNFS